MLPFSFNDFVFKIRQYVIPFIELTIYRLCDCQIYMRAVETMPWVIILNGMRWVFEEYFRTGQVIKRGVIF